MAQFKEIDDINFPFEVGVLPKREMALKFADYLNSIGIKATAKPGFGANYSVYVAEERDVSKAKLELLRFGNNPFAKAYNKASWSQGRSVKRERVVGAGSLGFSMGTYRWNLFTFASILEIVCILVYLCSLVPSSEQAVYGALGWITSWQVTENFQIWRVVTPILLHFSIIHIAFNIVMFEAFARPIERFFGTFKLVYIVLSIAVVSNILQFMFLPANAIFGGMSGVVYGIIGYMAVLSRRQDLPHELKLPPGLFIVSVVFIAFGFFFSGIANLCHLGGIILGVVLGFMDLKRPLRLLK